MYDLSSKFNTFYTTYVVLSQSEQTKLHNNSNPMLTISPRRKKLNRWELIRHPVNLRKPLETTLKKSFKKTKEN